MTAPRILVVDNHDSFTWNLVQALAATGARVDVEYADVVMPGRIAAGPWDGMVISPGPGRPEHAGNSIAAIRAAAATIPVLGVCLGHQALAMAFGGRVIRSDRPLHGMTSRIEHDGRTLFAGLPVSFRATRYHSLTVDPAALPGCFDVSARTAADTIMAIRHRTLPLEGVQFHPESILTVHGDRLLGNFVRSLSHRVALPPVARSW